MQKTRPTYPLKLPPVIKYTIFELLFINCSRLLYGIYSGVNSDVMFLDELRSTKVFFVLFPSKIDEFKSFQMIVPTDISFSSLSEGPQKRNVKIACQHAVKIGSRSVNKEMIINWRRIMINHDY